MSRAADMVREGGIACLSLTLKALMRCRLLLLARCVYPAFSHLILNRSPAQVARMERKRGLPQGVEK